VWRLGCNNNEIIPLSTSENKKLLIIKQQLTIRIRTCKTFFEEKPVLLLKENDEENDFSYLFDATPAPLKL
jgi:hypothetical protein